MATDFEGLINEAVDLPVSGWDTSPSRGRCKTGLPRVPDREADPPD